MAMIFSVVGQKGGTGKSMISRLLAVELATQKKSVALVDLDIAQRTSSEWSEARELNKIEPAVEVLVIDTDVEPDCRVPELAGSFDVIILDAPGFSDDLTVRIAAQADLVILPSGPGLDDVRPTIRLFHELSAAGIQPECIAIVLNKVATPAEEKSARDYLKKAGMSAIDAALHDKPSYRKAADHGGAASEVPAASLIEEAKRLAGEIAKRGNVCAKLRAQPAEQPKRFALQEGESW